MNQQQNVIIAYTTETLKSKHRVCRDDGSKHLIVTAAPALYFISTRFSVLNITTIALVILRAVRTALTDPKIIRPVTTSPGHVRHISLSFSSLLQLLLPHSTQHATYQGVNRPDNSTSQGDFATTLSLNLFEQQTSPLQQRN